MEGQTFRLFAYVGGYKQVAAKRGILKPFPEGTLYYIKYTDPATKKLRYEAVGRDFNEACSALAARREEARQGKLVTKPVAPILNVIEAYLTELTNEPKRSRMTITRKRTELMNFVNYSKLTHVDQIKRDHLIAYRNFLQSTAHNGQPYSDNTVINKLMKIVTWLKKNPVIKVVGLLETKDWPHKPDTDPKPYSEEELDAMMANANPRERLLLRLFLGTGMRDQEVAHAEVEDLRLGAKRKPYIRIEEKLKWNWRPKTAAGTRNVPIGDSLYADLKAYCSKGLLFPNETGNPERHYIRIIKAIAKKAQVEGAGCHRFRDTYATEQVYAGKLSLREIAKRLGHENLDMMDTYAAYVDEESKESREAANASDRYGSKPQLVKKTGTEGD